MTFISILFYSILFFSISTNKAAVGPRAEGLFFSRVKSLGTVASDLARRRGLARMQRHPFQLLLFDFFKKRRRECHCRSRCSASNTPRTLMSEATNGLGGIDRPQGLVWRRPAVIY